MSLHGRSIRVEQMAAASKQLAVNVQPVLEANGNSAKTGELGHLHQLVLAEPAIAGQEPARQTLADMERDAAVHREISCSQG